MHSTKNYWTFCVNRFSESCFVKVKINLDIILSEITLDNGVVKRWVADQIVATECPAAKSKVVITTLSALDCHSRSFLFARWQYLWIFTEIFIFFLSIQTTKCFATYSRITTYVRIRICGETYTLTVEHVFILKEYICTNFGNRSLNVVKYSVCP